MNDDYLFCPYCGGDPTEPDHLLHCDGRQGGRDDEPPPPAEEEIPRFRDTSIEAFFNAVDAGTLKAIAKNVWTALATIGDSTMIDVCRYFRTIGYFVDSRSVTPRFAELRKLGLVTEVGEGASDETGRPSIVWHAVTREEYRGPQETIHRCPTCDQVIGRTRKV